MLMAIMMTMIMQAKTRRTNAESNSRRASGWWPAASRDMIWGGPAAQKDRETDSVTVFCYN